MNNIDITTLAREITEAGATPPGELADLAADYEAAQALVGAGAFVPANRGGPAVVVRDEFVQAVTSRTLDAPLPEAMRAAAQEAAVQNELALIWRDLAKRMEAQAAKIVRAAGDDLIEQVRPSFEEAVARLAEVVELIGPEPVDAAKLLDKGSKAQIEVYTKHRVPAQDEVDRLLQVRTHVLAPLSYGERAIQVTWFLDPSHTWNATTRAQADKAWAKATVPSDRIGHLLAVGLPVTLNTHEQGQSIDAGIATRAHAKAQKEERLSEKERDNERRKLAKVKAGTGAKK